MSNKTKVAKSTVERRPLTPLELARDEVSDAVAKWIKAAEKGGEESAIARFDGALANFEFVAAVSHAITPPTGFVGRELARIESRLVAEEVGCPKWRELHAAQQALAWATDPEGFATPLDSIDGCAGTAPSSTP